MGKIISKIKSWGLANNLYIGMHLFGLISLFVVPLTLNLFWIFLISYSIRMFAITGGYHRYFSHRSYETSRFFQFLLAFLGCAAAQQGPLWWAYIHRKHHRHSDTSLDPHSPVINGFWYAHIGWVYDLKNKSCDFSKVKDLYKYPELVFLHTHHYLPPLLLALGTLYFGFDVFVYGFVISTLVLDHSTFLINSLTHMIGRQVFNTRDHSKNNFILALITFGEGWHNNHHYYPSASNMGFSFSQIDLTFYILKILEKTGLIWNLNYMSYDKIKKISKQ